MLNKKVFFTMILIIFILFIAQKSVYAQSFISTRSISFKEGEQIVIDVPNESLSRAQKYYFNVSNIAQTVIDTSNGNWLEAANIYCIQNPNDLGTSYKVHSQFSTEWDENKKYSTLTIKNKNGKTNTRKRYCSRPMDFISFKYGRKFIQMA